MGVSGQPVAPTKSGCRRESTVAGHGGRGDATLHICHDAAPERSIASWLRRLKDEEESLIFESLFFVFGFGFFGHGSIFKCTVQRH